MPRRQHRTFTLRLCLVLACSACGKSPEAQTKPTVAAPTQGSSAPAAKSAMLIEVDAVTAEITDVRSQFDTLEAGVDTAVKLVSEADDEAKRKAASTWIDGQAKARQSLQARLAVTRTRVAALKQMPSANEAEVNEASRAAFKAGEQLDHVEHGLGEHAANMQKALDALMSKQTDADRAAARDKLEQLKREAAEAKKRPKTP